jgi:C4-dicarboxylate transporter DctM subunit
VTPGFGLIIALVLFLGLIAAGMSVPFAILLPGMAYLFFLTGWTGLKALGFISWANLNNFTLTAIPLFILMAQVLENSGLIGRTYKSLAKLLSPIPGGLLQANIVGCAMFAAVSGSSVTTAAAIGTTALPQLMQRGYHKPLAAGSLAAGGTLGILVPPSLAMIVYSIFTETSVAKLFMAGVVPGILLSVMFMIYIGIRCAMNSHLAPREAGPESLHDASRLVLDLLPIGLLIAVTIGSMYLGWATPTEAATEGCILAMALAITVGDLTFVGFLLALRRSVLVVGNLMFLIFAAYVFSHAISFGGVGETVTGYIMGLQLTRTEFFLFLFVLYTVMGALVESVGMIVITVPLIVPMLSHYGIDPIWFGIVLVIFIEMGQISPPIGINLFVIQSLWQGKLSDVVRGTIPFHVLMLVLLLALVAFPAIALWLPGRL